ncbi:MAG: hypothetical protein KatS3mg114_0399 [Planctomycetaceae bacterium]|nr:MAG: hypothetical protein KatS3mg114_0399 [Planctomycetaceae bacterium]
MIVLSYNQSAYLEEALGSVLNQLDPPEHEVLVADDCSTDGTSALLDRLEAVYPQRFVRLPRPQNLGLSNNLRDAWQRAQGNYIALIEGDDVWCDLRKLQKVVAALQQHPHWTGCFHAVRPIGQRPVGCPEQLPPMTHHFECTFEQLLRREICIPTYSAVVYRRGVVTDIPAWHGRVACGDWGLHLLHAERGPLGYLPEPLTAYRYRAGSLWSDRDEIERWQQVFSLWAAVDVHYQGRYWREIEEARNAFIRECQQTLQSLRKIEARYHALGLHRVAAWGKWLRAWWQRLRNI